ncbi:hypothetical protein PFAG_00421 [Plasmodium falciparum Santa Lucia]|uniref:Uncharacterized protein n=2 Tax=Plasmodium falciparum TaxID=5833 RepID=A0A0L7KB81_PLAFX|nr:hypothetical protein PFAG_00421 [Plasmodium falciparum Santa Lucia]KOB60301.1 hypothetical protein PFHG_02031 [Plasmodium falciparum HB3]
MKLLKLDYYNGEIYEKYKINNILSLLVDNNKFQNESVDFHEISNKKNNYSIMAILGSQIKNLNDDIYKDIDTNDIILALSKLKKTDEEILINESQNKNYILELAEQIYYEYFQRGLIKNDHNFHLNNSKKNFIQINIELMNEINREIKNYEHKIHNLRAYSENAQTKNDASTNDLLMYYHEDVDNTDDSLLNENNFNYNMKHKKYNDQNKIFLNDHAHNNNHNNNNNDFFDRPNENNFLMDEENVLKAAHEDIPMNNDYVNYIHMKRDSLHNNNNNNNNNNYNNNNYNNNNYNNYKNNIFSDHHDLFHYNKEGTNSTNCNSVENLNYDINIYKNNKKNIQHINNNVNSNENIPRVSNPNGNIGNDGRNSYRNLSQLNEEDKHLLYNDTIKMDYLLNRKIEYEKLDEDQSESNNKSMMVMNTHRMMKNFDNMNKINSNVVDTYEENMNYKYDKNKSYVLNDEETYEHMSNKNMNNVMKNTGANNGANNGVEENCKYHIDMDNVHNAVNSVNLQDNIYKNNNSSNTLNSVLENIDKAEQQIVKNHLKNSLAHNEYVAKRMSSLLLNPQNVIDKEPYNNNIRKAYEKNGIMNRDEQKYFNDEISLNKYSSTYGQKKNFTTDTNNSSSFILSTIHKPNMVDESSYNIMNNYENKKFRIQSRNMNTRENYLHNQNSNHHSTERSHNINNNMINHNNHISNTTPLNFDNMSNYSRNAAKSVESNMNIYTNKYSRALDINDLNSNNTSRNYVNSSNSLKSDLTMMRDNYAKMLERSKSLTSHLYRAPIMHNKYLKANM